MMMMEDLMEHVGDWKDEDEVADYLELILRGKANDHSGLLYGIGHAVYTLSDPRAEILKDQAHALAEKKGLKDKFDLFGWWNGFRRRFLPG